MLRRWQNTIVILAFEKIFTPVISSFSDILRYEKSKLFIDNVAQRIINIYVIKCNVMYDV